MTVSLNRMWSVVELGDHVDLLTGHPFKSAHYTEDPDDIRLLRGDNVAQGWLRWANAKRWPADQVQEFDKFRLRLGDVILAMDRPWIPAGLKYAWVKEADQSTLLVQRVARMRGANGLSTTYLRYLIGSPQFTDHVMSIITGVNVPHISARDIRAFKFLLPPLPTQRRIADILSTYDDLIENNTRRIAILEELTRRLYEEWFVHFRFPDHEGVRMVESEIGPVPEGWEVRSLSEIAEVNSESIRKGNAPQQINYIDIKSVSAGRIASAREMSFSDAPSRARRVVRSGDILWSAVRPNLRAFALILNPSPDTIASTGFAVIRPSEAPFSYLYPALTTENFVEYLINHTTGAAYPAVNQKDFETARLVVPPSTLLDTYDRIACALLVLGHNLNSKNANLRAQRDLLLPKLISGEIDVSEAGESVMEAAE